MDYNVSFRDIIYQLTPYWLRTRKTLLYLYASIKALKDVNILFLDYYDKKRRILKHNAQTIYIEHYLNLEYDPINEGIYIENISNSVITYVFNTEEGQPPLYTYNLYNNTEAYVVGDFISYGNTIYECISNTTGNNPTNATYWSETQEQIYFYNNGESGASYNFIIWIPDAIKITCGYPNYTTFKAKANQFIFSDKTYLIQTY
jgi:hypothetical protein